MCIKIYIYSTHIGEFQSTSNDDNFTPDCQKLTFLKQPSETSEKYPPENNMNLIMKDKCIKKIKTHLSRMT